MSGFVHTAEDGETHAFRGEYGEIVENERITWTFEYEGMPGHIHGDDHQHLRDRR